MHLMGRHVIVQQRQRVVRLDQEVVRHAPVVCARACGQAGEQVGQVACRRAGKQVEQDCT